MSAPGWVALLGAVTGTLGFGLSIWNAVYAQRERLRVELRKTEKGESGRGRAGLYIRVVNLCPFEVQLERIALVTKGDEGKSEHPVELYPQKFPISLPSRRAVDGNLTIRAAVFASMDPIVEVYAQTSTGKRVATRKRKWWYRRRLNDIVPGQTGGRAGG